jgi:very-short-patch-repair endonuclease
MTVPTHPTGLETRRPFTRADAIAADVSPKQLRGSRFRRIFRGVYVDAGIPDHPLIRAQAALALHPANAYASHVSAARIYRVPVPKISDEHVTVSEVGDRSRVAGIHCHVAERPPTEVRTLDGVRVSAPCVMFVELASVLDLVDLVVVGDALARLKLASPQQLVGWCAASTDRFAVAARRAAGYVRERVDSAMETRLRMLIVLAGLPEPEVNFEISDETGHLLYRLDLSYPDLRLVIEYDGRQHAEDVHQWGHDLDRREWFDDEKWRVLIVTSKGIYQEPERTLQRIHKALAERGCPVLPRRLSDAWRPYFPAR